MFIKTALREKCPYSELFWPAFFRIRTEYGEILLISPYSVRMRENTDQNNSEYGHFLRSEIVYDYRSPGKKVTMKIQTQKRHSCHSFFHNSDKPLLLDF